MCQGLAIQVAGVMAGWLCEEMLSCPTVVCVMEVQWCTISDAEQQKCKDMSEAFQGAGIRPSLLCVQGNSADHCVQLIKVRPLPPECSPTLAQTRGL